MGKILNTAAALIDALGGNKVVGAMLGLTEQAVSNWKRFGVLPPYTERKITSALAKRGLKADPDLWERGGQRVA